MKIGVDIWGGDYAPDAVLEGVILAHKAGKGYSLTLFGDAEIIRSRLEALGYKDSSFEIVHAPDQVEMAASPVKSLHKSESSLVKGFDYLKNGQIDGFASAGNTGAMLAGSVLKIGAIRESIRPCLITHVPKIDGSTGILTDIGANADCKPENLVDFAILGSCYAEFILGLDNPRIGLINIGEEPEKGNSLTIATHQLLSQLHNINFIGNVESRELFSNKTDVMVCSGFVGNVIIKLAEGIYDLLKSKGFSSSFFENMNYEAHGGSPVLGVNKPVVVGHGISNAVAIQNMIGLTSRLVEVDLCDKIKEAIQYV